MGNPVSLHEYCTSRGVSRVGRSLVPKGVVLGQLVERTLALDVGYNIIDKIHNGMKLPSTSLVAAILLQHKKGMKLGMCPFMCLCEVGVFLWILACANCLKVSYLTLTIFKKQTGSNGNHCPRPNKL